MIETVPDWLLAIVVVQLLGGIGWAINQKLLIEKLRVEVEEVRRDQVKSDMVVATMGLKLDNVLLGNARIEEQIKTLFDMVRRLTK